MRKGGSDAVALESDREKKRNTQDGRCPDATLGPLMPNEEAPLPGPLAVVEPLGHPPVVPRQRRPEVNGGERRGVGGGAEGVLQHRGGGGAR